MNAEGEAISRASAPTPVGELTYVDASRELDGIVGFFEQRDVDVDQLVERLERATAIVDELDRRIRRTRAQVEALVPRLQAAGRAAVADADAEIAGEPRSTRSRPGAGGGVVDVSIDDAPGGDEFVDDDFDRDVDDQWQDGSEDGQPGLF